MTLRRPRAARRSSCDPLLLTTALDNLVRNAMEAAVAAKDLGKVSEPACRCSCCAEAVAAVVRVEDNAGGPLGRSWRRRLFEPFVTTKPQGIGLGLAMTRQAVEQQGGTLRLRAPASGSRFIRVRCRSRRRAHEPVDPLWSMTIVPSPPRGGGAAARGLPVRWRARCTRPARRWQARTPELVVLDRRLPDGDGLTSCPS